MSAPPDLLPRLDGRFLLPPAPGGTWDRLVLLGGPPGLADAAREAGIARQVVTEVPSPPAPLPSPSLPPGEGRKASHDPELLSTRLFPPLPVGGREMGEGGQGGEVLFFLRGSRVPLEEAVRVLRPGGTAYIESGERRRVTAPDAPLRRTLVRLRRCGLTVTGIWAVWPDPEHWQVCLPLGAPASLSWFARTLYPAPTAREATIQAGLRLLPGRAAALLLTRSFAFTAVAGPAVPSPPTVLVTHGRERVLALPFPQRGTAPAGVLKISRLPAFNAKAEKEQEALARVRQALGEGTAEALPAPRGIEHRGGIAVGSEGYLPGRPLGLTGTDWGASLARKVADMRLAASWITGMHRRTEVARSPWSGTEIATWIKEPCEAFRRRLGTVAAEERLFTVALDRARELRGLPFPTVLRHRDFTPWNLLRDGARLCVLDWEGLEPGPPLCDLLHFLTHWGEMARGAADPAARFDAFRQTLLTPQPGDPVAAAADEAIAAYCAEMRLDRAFVPLLLVHTWVEIALRGSSNLDNAYVGTLAACAEELFGRPGDARRAA